MEDEILHLLQASPTGSLNDNQVKLHFGEKYDASDLVAAINSLLRLSRIQLFTNSSGTLVYKVVDEDIAVKFDGLGPEQMMVFQAIEKSGNRGIWTRDIKNQTNIPQHT